MANLAQTQTQTTTTNNVETQAVVYSAKVISKASAPREKANGAISVGLKVLLLDGPGKGLAVFANRTIKNRDGVEKSIPQMDEIVSVYHTQVPSTTGEGMMNFFDIGTGSTASNEMLNSVFGNIASQEDDI